MTDRNGDILAVCFGAVKTKELSCGHCSKNRILQLEDRALQEELENRTGEKQRGRQTEGGMCFHAPQLACRVTMMSPDRSRRMWYNGVADKFGETSHGHENRKIPPMRGGGRGLVQNTGALFLFPGNKEDRHVQQRRAGKETRGPAAGEAPPGDRVHQPSYTSVT